MDLSARDAELLKLTMAAQALLEDAFIASFEKWRLAGSGATVRQCLQDESADALALCRELGVPIPDTK